MNKLTLTVFCISVLCLFSCTKSIDQKIEELEKEKTAFDKKVKSIKDDTLRIQAEEMGNTLFRFEKIDLENQRIPSAAEYAPNPLLLLDDYPSTTELVNHYANGILVNEERDSQSQKDLKIIYPFSFPFQKKMIWTDLKMSDNSILPLKEDSDYTDDPKEILALKAHDLAFNEINVYYPSHTSSNLKPASIIGSMDAVAPKAVLQFRFSMNDNGKTQEKNGIRVKLLAIKDHYVKLEITNPLKTDPSVNTDDLDWVKVQARDTSSQYLDYSGNSHGADGLIKFYKTILDKIISDPKNVKSLQKDLEIKEKEFSAKNKDKYYSTTYFKGRVKDVIVYVLDYSKVIRVKKDLTSTVSKFNTSLGKLPIAEIKTSAVVYDHEIPDLFKVKSELSDNELDAAIHIEQTPYKQATENNNAVNAKINFVYPTVWSTMFSEVFERYGKLKSITFYDKKNGTAIDLPQDSLNIEHNGATNPWVESFSKRIEYNPTKFPKQPHYASGVLEVELLTIKRTSFGLNNLPAGIKVKGNQLVIDGNLLKEQYNRYFVKDKTGKYLKLITSGNYQNQKNYNDFIAVKYYYGLPFTIERYENTDSHIAQYEFGLELNQNK